ncbi:DUF1932 domain-containing protein [Streptomyces sp. 4N124]|uniref:DUF1932 domain-containing protein n=1 Tax=Streptomyces sp. 4N124 TaxID=3457420 RepID=UPI003FD37749
MKGRSWTRSSRRSANCSRCGRICRHRRGLRRSEGRLAVARAETDYIPKTAARAWRWGPELEDAAALLADAGLPDARRCRGAHPVGRQPGRANERC